MGTLSLIFGIISIGIGVGFAINAFLFTVFSTPDFFAYLGIAVIGGGIGAFLIQKYDEDKKKSGV